ncbi:DUF4864 domain-containing protein [Methylobrevis albus]|nr:DUF4864 domain-containing protein [Methylobrevis albus]
MASLYSRLSVSAFGQPFHRAARQAAGALIAGTIVAGMLLASPAAADEAAAPDAGDFTAIQAVIGEQIAAFKADDSARAYSFAAPQLQQVLGNADTFMSMVKQGYQPVYRPKAVTFGQLRDTAKGLVQEVFLVGPDGADWTALYMVERQPDGTWRIAGCKLAKQERVAA